VVIAGYGFAGAAAAITAHDRGASVLILEKAQQQFRGGNSRVSANGVFWPNDVEKAKVYFRAFSGAYMDDISDEMLKVWTNELYANAPARGPRLEAGALGGAEYPDLPVADVWANLCTAHSRASIRAIVVPRTTFYVGNMKGVGRIYQLTFIDTYAKVACAKLYDRKTPITAADLLNDRVPPFFEEHDVC
jgi:FAD binding domain